MQLSKIFFAVLPALVLAEDGASTTTCTATTTLTKTMTLSKVQTFTASPNSTTTHSSTVGTTSYFTSPIVTATTSSGEEPPAVTDGPDNAGSALDATRVVVAGALGMVAVALM